MEATGSTAELPLFPLSTVLVPGAELRLRIFEARYLDLVRSCSREGTGFGICLVLDAPQEEGMRSSAAVGTEACISDFGTTEDGLLALTVVGARRFHVDRARVRDNGLVLGEVRWFDPPGRHPVRAEHGLLVQLLRRILDHFGGRHAAADAACFDDADWVGWRLVELLPLEDAQRQELLEQSDPHRRLDRLLELIPDLPRD